MATILANRILNGINSILIDYSFLFSEEELKVLIFNSVTINFLINFDLYINILYLNIINKETNIFIVPTNIDVVIKPNLGNNNNGNAIEPISPPM